MVDSPYLLVECLAFGAPAALPIPLVDPFRFAMHDRLPKVAPDLTICPDVPVCGRYVFSLHKNNKQQVNKNQIRRERTHSLALPWLPKQIPYLLPFSFSVSMISISPRNSRSCAFSFVDFRYCLCASLNSSIRSRYSSCRLAITGVASASGGKLIGIKYLDDDDKRWHAQKQRERKRTKIVSCSYSYTAVCRSHGWSER